MRKWNRTFFFILSLRKIGGHLPSLCTFLIFYVTYRNNNKRIGYKSSVGTTFVQLFSLNHAYIARSSPKFSSERLLILSSLELFCTYIKIELYLGIVF